MDKQSRRFSLITVLFCEFIDYAGVSIVYPLFAYMLFDKSFHFLPQEATDSFRGLWLGILIALHPLLQFFCAPLFGTLSDLKGRKRLLRTSLLIGMLGYGFACLACFFQSLWLLALYRICVGISAGNSSVISAIVADLSTPENKAKNYGLLNMAFGAGFTIGPFLSGILAQNFHLSTPFLASLCFVAINYFLIGWKLQETRPLAQTQKIRLFAAFQQIKQATLMRELRFVFLGLLIFSFGWSFFTEFSSVFLIHRYQFTPNSIGIYYAYTGLFYAFSAGFLIDPFIRRLKIEKTLFLSMFFSGIYLLVFFFIDTPTALWFYLPVLQFFLSFVYPAICAVISNRVSPERQGEAMGMYQGVIALALAITPLCSGLFVGRYPVLVILVSGFLMVAASLVNFLLRRDESAAVNVD